MRKLMIAMALTASTMASAQKLELPKISGFINARYQYNSANEVKEGFDIRRVRLAASGNIGEKLDYKFQAEYETSVKVLDAFLRWKIQPEFNIQVGQFKVAYTQETLYGPTSWLVANNPTVIAKLNGYDDLSGLKSNGRDIGVRLYGDLVKLEDGHPLFSYKVGLYNGSGINTTAKKNNKDLSALIYINPVKQLSITGGHYQGSYGTVGDEHVRIRTSFGAQWKDEKLTVRSEGVLGNTAGVKSNGLYAQAAYFVTPKVQPVLAYDYFKANNDVSSTVNNYQVGVNILPIKHIRIQAGYTYSKETDVDGKHSAVAQLFVEF